MRSTRHTEPISSPIFRPLMSCSHGACTDTKRRDRQQPKKCRIRAYRGLRFERCGAEADRRKIRAGSGLPPLLRETNLPAPLPSLWRRLLRNRKRRFSWNCDDGHLAASTSIWLRSPGCRMCGVTDTICREPSRLVAKRQEGLSCLCW